MAHWTDRLEQLGTDSNGKKLYRDPQDRTWYRLMSFERRGSAGISGGQSFVEVSANEQQSFEQQFSAQSQHITGNSKISWQRQALNFAETYAPNEYPELYPVYSELMYQLSERVLNGSITQEFAMQWCGDNNIDLYMLKDAWECLSTPSVLAERLANHERKIAEKRAAQQAESETQQVRITPAIIINNPPPSSLQDVKDAISQAIRDGKDYDKAIEEAYNNFPSSLVNQATGR